jgi:hypothetical protein
MHCTACWGPQRDCYPFALAATRARLARLGFSVFNGFLKCLYRVVNAWPRGRARAVAHRITNTDCVAVSHNSSPVVDAPPRANCCGGCPLSQTARHPKYRVNALTQRYSTTTPLTTLTNVRIAAAYAPQARRQAHRGWAMSVDRGAVGRAASVGFLVRHCDARN